MSRFPGREATSFGLFIGLMMAIMPLAGWATGTIPPDRRVNAAVIFPIGVMLAVWAGDRLRRLKAAEPPQSWVWFLRNELRVVVIGAVMAALVALFPETAEAVTDGLREFIDAIQMLKAGRP